MPTTGPAALDERPRRRRAALLAAPWVFALALGLAALVTRPGASASPDTTPDTLTATDATDTTDTPNPTDAGADAAATAAPTERVPPAPTTHTAVAADALPPSTRLQVLAQARVALGTAGLTSQAGSGIGGVGGAGGVGRGPGDQWPIEVRVTGVAPVTDTLAIATVHGLVIQWVDGGWSGPVTKAVAVPLTTAPHPRVAGPAWPITSPPVVVDAPDGQEVADPDPAVLDPLERAGWSVDELTTVELVDGAVLRVGLVGTPPHGTEAGHHVVWLLDAPGEPRLLPLEAPPSTQEST